MLAPMMALLYWIVRRQSSTVALEGGAYVSTKLKLKSTPSVESEEQLSSLNLEDFNSSVSLLPVTQFTPHVMALITTINLSSVTDCPNYYKLQIDKPMSVPTILGFSRIGIIIENEWTKLMSQIFSRPGRVLKSNITFGTTWGDYNLPGGSCVGSSSPGGNTTMTNFLSIKAQVVADPADESVWGKFAISWGNRSKVPIFRGTGYGAKGDCNTYESVLSNPDSVRLKAVDFSVDYPTLLNARLSMRTFKAPCWHFNASNGLDKLMLVDDIDKKLYYTNYQAALVIGGIGAAFRLDSHLSTGTAVVLQQFQYEEWFTHLLKPWVHYIPLAQDLSNLNETMHWVRDHPLEVQAIGAHGLDFYNQFLSFSRNEEHVYEFLMRLPST
jgi:hypothetical protein